MEPIAVMTKLTKKGWSNCTFLCAAGSTKCYTFCQLLPEIKGTRKLFQKEYFAFISLLVTCFRTTIVSFMCFFCLFVCFFISRGFTTKSRSKGALYLLQSSKILIMKDFQLLLHNDIFSENKMTRICVNFQTSLNLQHSIPKIHVNCLAPS